MEYPTRTHMSVKIKVLRCLRSIIDYGILFLTCENNSNTNIICYLDEGQCDDKVDKGKGNTTGYYFKFFDSPICWLSRK